MKLQKQFFIILIGLAASNCQSASLSRATFGESCDKGIRCDSRSSLSCIDNTCQCVKPEEMTYSKQKGKCVVLSGERCSYTAVEILMDQTQEKRWTERLDCVDHAVCNNEGYCDCQDAFYEGPEGSCIPKRFQGENCTSDNECRIDKHLMCVDGLCSCNQTEAVFDPTYGQCVAKAGASCLKYENCVRNAICPRRRGGYYNNQYRDLCTCSSEYKVSKSGLCLAKYGMSCDVNSAPCSEEFACINGICKCHFPDHQIYNKTAYQCVSYVRGPCSEIVEGTFPCVPKAECKKSQDGISECQCIYGYIESINRECDIAHGQTCGQSSESCDQVANLKCRNGKCTCADFQIYDKETFKCRGLVGSMCTANDTCVEGAKCTPYRDANLLSGVCRCVPPSVPDSTRKCTSPTVVELKNFIDVVNGTVESMEEEIILADTPSF